MEIEIRRVLQQQIEGWNDGDIPAYMKGYTKSDSLRFASGGSVTYGWQNTLERYSRRYTDAQTMGTLTFSGVTVDSLAPDAAVVFGTWRLQRATDAPWGLFTLLFKKSNDGWRIIHDHTSSGN